MRKLLFVLFFVFTTISTSFANGPLPDWILPELNRYPLETYLFDVGRSEGTGEEAYRKAAAKAHKKVAEKILRQVVRIIGVNENSLQYGMVLEHYSAVLEDYCSWHHASPALQLEGLSYRNLSVDNARTEQETFALVYIERDKLKKIYANHELRLHEEIKHRLEMAKAAEEDLDKNRAVRTYLRTYPLYESLKEAEIIQIGTEFRPDYRKTFRRLADAATKTVGNPLPHRNVIKRVKELDEKIIVNFIDIFDVIDFQLSPQIESPRERVLVHPLIYEDSEMISPFALKFTEALIHGMSEWVFVDPMLELKQPPIDIGRINRDLPPLRLSASCWVNGDGITIRSTLRNINTGEFIASSVVEFLKTNMRDTLTYQPRGYDKAQIEKKAFNPRYFVKERGNNTETPTSEVLAEYQFSPIGGLKVDLWTDRGRGPLSYTEGDKVKIFARVDQPVYLRLINIHADQKRALLKDNFYIGPEKVNSNVEIGEFLCAPPFGTEFVVVAAQTEKFPFIPTREEDGYFFLVEEDAAKAAASFRGLKPIPKESNDKQFIGPQPIIDEQPSFQQNGAQLTLTIMEK
jgi:hypothetical protein